MKDSSSFEKCCGNVSQGSKPVNGPGQGPDGLGAAKRSLFKAAGIVGLMTLTSRILGMIRDMVSADRFGTSWQWDSFLYAFMLPNFLRRIVGEGALSSAFIPVYTELLEKEGKPAAFRFANVVITLLGTGLAGILIVFHLGIRLGLSKSSVLQPSIVLTLELLQAMLPYLWFISIFAVGMGILNAHQHFWAPGMGPVLLDLFWIGGVLWICPLAAGTQESELGYLALVVLISGAVQLAVEIPPLLRLGFRIRWIWDTANEGLRKTLKLIFPAMMGFAVIQMNLFIDSTFALAMGEGANSSLWYGSRMMQFPLGLFAVSLGTALLPTISAQLARKEFDTANKTISFSLRSIFLITLPSTVGLILLSRPIVQMLFERGEFNAESTSRSAAVMVCYSIGLVAFSGQKMIAASYYSLQDSKTPVRIGWICILVHLVLNFILGAWMKEAGLALSTSLAGMLQFVMFLSHYHKKIAPLPLREILTSLTRILAATVLMGLLCGWLSGVLNPGDGNPSAFQLIIRVSGIILATMVSFIIFCVIFRVRELAEAWRFFCRKKTAL